MKRIKKQRPQLTATLIALSEAVTVAGSTSGGYAVLKDGTVWTWGGNHRRKLEPESSSSVILEASHQGSSRRRAPDEVRLASFPFAALAAAHPQRQQV